MCKWRQRGSFCGVKSVSTEAIKSVRGRPDDVISAPPHMPSAYRVRSTPYIYRHQPRHHPPVDPSRHYPTSHQSINPHTPPYKPLSHAKPPPHTPPPTHNNNSNHPFPHHVHHAHHTRPQSHLRRRLFLGRRAPIPPTIPRKGATAHDSGVHGGPWGQQRAIVQIGMLGTDGPRRGSSGGVRSGAVELSRTGGVFLPHA